MVVMLALLALNAVSMGAKELKGNGKIVTREITLSDDFTAIDMNRRIFGDEGGSWFSWFGFGHDRDCSFEYTQGESSGLRITIDENLYPYVQVQIKKGELSFTTKESVELSPTELKIEGCSKQLNRVKISGGIDFLLRSALSGDQLDIRASGGSDVLMKEAVRVADCEVTSSGGSDLYLTNLACRAIEASASGGSDLYLGGRAETGDLSVSGGSDVKASDFVAKRLECSASGGSDAYVHATDYLDASASGGSDVYYKGSPKMDVSSSGGSDVRKMRD